MIFLFGLGCKLPPPKGGRDPKNIYPSPGKTKKHWGRDACPGTVLFSFRSFSFPIYLLQKNVAVQNHIGVGIYSRGRDLRVRPYRPSPRRAFAAQRPQFQRLCHSVRRTIVAALMYQAKSLRSRGLQFRTRNLGKN